MAEPQQRSQQQQQQTERFFDRAARAYHHINDLQQRWQQRIDQSSFSPPKGTVIKEKLGDSVLSGQGITAKPLLSETRLEMTGNNLEISHRRVPFTLSISVPPQEQLLADLKIAAVVTTRSLSRDRSLLIREIATSIKGSEHMARETERQAACSD